MKTNAIVGVGLALMVGCADSQGSQEDTWKPTYSRPVEVTLSTEVSDVRWAPVISAVATINEQVGFQVFSLILSQANETNRVDLKVGNYGEMYTAEVSEETCIVQMDVAGDSSIAALGLLECLGFKAALVGEDLAPEVVKALRTQAHR